MFRSFKIMAMSLASIAASQKSIAMSLSVFVNQSPGLSEADKQAILTSTAVLSAAHDRLQTALDAAK